MRLGHIGQRIALVDTDLDLTAGHHAEQVVAHGLRGLARGDMGEQCRPRQIDRALGRQRAHVDGRHRPGSPAKAGQQPEGREAVQRALPGVGTHRVIDHLHAPAPGDLAHPGGEIDIAPVVDRVRRPVLQRQLAFLVAAGGGNQPQAEGACPLAGDQPDTARGGMEEHEVTRLQAALRQRLAQQVLHGQALEHHCRAGLEVDGLGQLEHALGRHHARRRIGARRVAGIGGTVAGPQVADALAHRLDDARPFHAQAGRQRQRIGAVAVIDVDVVQPAGVVADADLARAGLAHLDVHPLQLLRAARGLDDDGLFAHLLLLVAMSAIVPALWPPVFAGCHRPHSLPGA
mmetsp:Transcript_885/g.2059  ORF Transcript_885/g.2059 Transcript_885/m.2059 type:complete len:345 (-) Transcript_885:1610-2644(-)